MILIQFEASYSHSSLLCVLLGHVQKWPLDLGSESGGVGVPVALCAVGFWSETKCTMSSHSVSLANSASYSVYCFCFESNLRDVDKDKWDSVWVESLVAAQGD